MDRPCFGAGCAGRPFGQRINWWAGGWVEWGLVGLAGAGGGLEGVVYFEDDAFGAVVAVVCFFVLATDDGEGVHDVADSIAGVGKAASSEWRMANGEWLPVFVHFSILDSPLAIRLRLEIRVEEGGDRMNSISRMRTCRSGRIDR